MKTSLYLVYGGKSAEHEVSLQTAKAVISAVDKAKYDITPIYITSKGEWVRGPQIDGPVDDVKKLQFTNEEATSAITIFQGAEQADQPTVVFPLLHGPNGEDGTVQGMLELLNVPYVGNGVLASAAGMDKIVMKNLFAQAGLEQVNYVATTKHEWKENQAAIIEEMENHLGYPCFVKPANLGSSVGISKASNREGLVEAMNEALKFDRRIIVEQGVIAREIEVGVLGNEKPACSVVGEIVPTKDFYDYKAKYVDGDTAMIIPAQLSEEVVKEVKEKAIVAYKVLDCAGLVRADFFLTEDGKLVINEVNTMPGFTPFSMFPLLWKHAGVEYPDLIEKLVSLALSRYEEKQQIQHTM